MAFVLLKTGICLRNAFLHSKEFATNLTTVPIYLSTLNTIVDSKDEKTQNNVLYSFYNNMNARFTQAKRHLWSFTETCFFIESLLTKQNYHLLFYFKTYFLFFKMVLIQYLAIIPFLLLFILNFVAPFLYSNFTETERTWNLILTVLQVVLFLAQLITLVASHYLLKHLLNQKKINDHEQYHQLNNLKEDEQLLSNEGFFTRFYIKHLKFNLIFNILEFYTSNLLSSFLFSFIPGLFCLTKLLFTDQHAYQVAPKPKEKLDGEYLNITPRAKELALVV